MKVVSENKLVFSNGESVLALAQMLLDRKGIFEADDLAIGLHKGQLDKALKFMMRNTPTSSRMFSNPECLELVAIMSVMSDILDGYTKENKEICEILRVMFYLAQGMIEGKDEQ
jgi:hypothetical protein